MPDDIPAETRQLPPRPAARGASSEPERTAVLDSPERYRRGSAPSQIALGFLAITLAGFLLGICVGVVTRQTAPDGEVLVSRSVGRQGGVVRFAGGEIRIPPRALAERETIVVRRSTIEEGVAVQGSDQDQPFVSGTLAAYSFEPADVRLRRGVDITLRLPGGARNGSVFVRRGTGVALLPGTVDPERGTVTTTVRDFRFRP